MAGLQLLAKPGAQTNSDGAEHILRSLRDGSLAVSQFLARYGEAVARGQVFHAGNLSAGVAPGTAIGTTSPFTLYNPANSGKRLVVLKASMGYISGTLGAGTVFWVANVNPIAAAVTGTALTKVNALLGSSAAGVASALHTATLPAAPTIIRPFCSLGAHLASTAVQPWQVTDQVDGEIVVDEGGAVSLEAVAAAGSTPLVAYGISWMEVSV